MHEREFCSTKQHVHVRCYYLKSFRNMPLSSGGEVKKVHIPLCHQARFITLCRDKNESVSKGTVLQFLQILECHSLKFAPTSILNIPYNNKHYIFLVLPFGLIITSIFSSEDAIKIFKELYNETIIFIKLFAKKVCLLLRYIQLN